jgi:hypothetical protein
MDIDLRSLKLPKKLNINYDEQINSEEENNKGQR